MKRIAFGIHVPQLLQNYVELSEILGYTASYTSSQEEMLRMVKSTESEVYVMEANLGHPGSDDISSAIAVWEVVAPRVKNGLAKFVAISGNDIALDQARKREIPVGIKGSFSLGDFLER